MPPRIGANDRGFQRERPRTALARLVVPAVTERPIVGAKIPDLARRKITTVAIGIAYAVQIPRSRILRKIVITSNQGAVGIAIAAVARRTAVNMDTSMCIAARGRTSCARGTGCFNAGDQRQQKQCEI